jgi:hypothetical protein
MYTAEKLCVILIKMYKLSGLNGTRANAASLVLMRHIYEISGKYDVAEAHPNN